MIINTGQRTDIEFLPYVHISLYKNRTAAIATVRFVLSAI